MNARILQFDRYERDIRPEIRPASFDGGAGGGDNGGMELTERVGRLETDMQDVRVRLTKIESRLESIDTHMATKADLAEAMNNMVKWIVGTAVALGASAITIMTFVLNNASPKAPSPQQPAPIVITLPTPAAAPQTPAQ